MVAAVRMGFGRATRWSVGGRAWASSLAAGMVLAGAAVVLLAWSVEPALNAPGTSADVREVDFDDPARIIVTSDDQTIFDTPLQPVPAGTSTPTATPNRAITDPAPPAGPTRGGTDPGTRPDPITGGGTSTPTPTAPAPTTPAPTTDGGTSPDGGVVPVPGTTPTPPSTPTPPVGGGGTTAPGVNVAVTGTGATVSVGAGINVTAERGAQGSIVNATTPVATVAASTSLGASTLAVTAGSTSATLDTTTSTATLTAGGITLTVPLLGAVRG